MLPDLKIINFAIHKDARGSFGRLFCTQELSSILGERKIVQINQSTSHQIGTVRGLHLQKAPYAETKLVRCIQGKVWDVAVDLRAASPTFLQWHAEELSAQNNKMFLIPEGFAHGFQVLEPNSQLLYLHTAAYAPKYESGVHPLDPTLAICWPYPIQELSTRDQELPEISPNFRGFS